MKTYSVNSAIPEVEMCRALMTNGTSQEFRALLGSLIGLWEAVRDSKKTTDEGQVQATTNLPLLRQLRETSAEATNFDLDRSTKNALCEGLEMALGYSMGVKDAMVLAARNSLARLLAAIAATQQVRLGATAPATAPAPATTKSSGSVLPWILGGLAIAGLAGVAVWASTRSGSSSPKLRGFGDKPGVDLGIDKSKAIDTTANVIRTERRYASKTS